MGKFIISVKKKEKKKDIVYRDQHNQYNEKLLCK